MMRSVTAGWLLAAGALAGCASSATPPASLESARVQVREVSADPDVVRYARTELEAAQDAFASAERGIRRQLDPQVIEHWAHLAQQRAAIARETARLRRAEEGITALRTESPQGAATAAPSTASGAADSASISRGALLSLGEDQFEHDRFAPKPEAEAGLDRIARLLKEDSSRTVRIDGHTEEMDDRNRSLMFAGRRAEAVRGELVGRGIEPRRVHVRALGDSYPIASNETQIGRERNRRVEIYVLGDGTRVDQ